MDLNSKIGTTVTLTPIGGGAAVTGTLRGATAAGVFVDGSAGARIFYPYGSIAKIDIPA